MLKYSNYIVNYLLYLVTPHHMESKQWAKSWFMLLIGVIFPLSLGSPVKDCGAAKLNDCKKNYSGNKAIVSHKWISEHIFIYSSVKIYWLWFLHLNTMEERWQIIYCFINPFQWGRSLCQVVVQMLKHWRRKRKVLIQFLKKV